MTDNTLLDYLKELIARTEENVAESRVWPNSCGAGYDIGYLDALRLVRQMIEAKAKGEAVPPEAFT